MPAREVHIWTDGQTPSTQQALLWLLLVPEPGAWYHLSCCQATKPPSHHVSRQQAWPATRPAAKTLHGNHNADRRSSEASLLQSDDSPDLVTCDPALRSLFGQDSLKLSELGSRVGPLLLPLPPHTLAYTIRYLTLTW